MPLGLFTMCLALGCLLRVNRADSCTWGFHGYMSAHARLSPMTNHTLEVCPAFQMHVDGYRACPLWVVYHVFSMSFHLFFVFRKGGQRHMGVQCTGVRPCMAVPPTRNYTLEVFCTFQLDLYAQIVCPKGCLPYGQHKLTSIYWVSIWGTAMHEGFHAKLSRHA